MVLKFYQFVQTKLWRHDAQRKLIIAAENAEFAGFAERGGIKSDQVLVLVFFASFDM
jgi:hypothetical protein